MDDFIFAAVVVIAIVRAIIAGLKQASQMPQATRTLPIRTQPLRITPPSERRQASPSVDDMEDLEEAEPLSLDEEAEELLEDAEVVEELPEAEPVAVEETRAAEAPPVAQRSPLSRFPANMPPYLEGIIWSEILNPPLSKRRPVHLR